MNTINKITKISIALLVLTSSSVVSAKIYKWVDDQGQMHYTQRPAPIGKDATNIERKIRIAADLPTSSSVKTTKPKAGKYGSEAKPRQQTKAKKEAVVTKPPEDKQAKNSAEEYEKKLAEYCEKQTANLEALNSDTPIAWQNEGKTKLLSNTERKEKINAINTSINENCKAKKEQKQDQDQ
ncbi:MAG: Unknown protein [uncultured Thiotrichaceae bacterium]|uniref:DUF4124 domain-containing protein n=1 Tax=uncultured Thiotrichaceae bacterium TaxID=298394 RepID=A0A6S6TH10_9GAMM|nr:MAG: Unknown protein [uncultured Thiotrichaceae bacterium]